MKKPRLFDTLWPVGVTFAGYCVYTLARHDLVALIQLEGVPIALISVAIVASRLLI
jgi:hypothetical protein